MDQAHAVDLQQASREKTGVAVSSLLAAVLLTALKLVVGVSTNSLGVLSEAAHSALDLVAAGVTLWAVRISSRPASREYTYGHGKFENLSALFETFLLLATCLGIVYEAAQRLVFHHRTTSRPALGVSGHPVVDRVDFSRSRALRRCSQKYHSQALEADALHFSTDIWSSLVVLLGLAGVWAGGRWNLPALETADAVAALGVAAVIVWVSLRLGKKSVDDLLDRVPLGLQEKVAEAAAATPGVLQVAQVRLRRSGPEFFADVTLSVGHATSFEQAHEVSDAAAAAVRAILPGADVVVHAEPAPSPNEELTTTVRVLAARHGLGAHGIRIYDEEKQRWIELHLEVDGRLSLDEAHAQATAFERELRRPCPTYRGSFRTWSRAATPRRRSARSRPPRSKSASPWPNSSASIGFPASCTTSSPDRSAASCRFPFIAGWRGDGDDRSHSLTVKLEEFLRGGSRASAAWSFTSSRKRIEGNRGSRGGCGAITIRPLSSLPKSVMSPFSAP